MFVKHLLHIGEKRREELIGGLPVRGRIGKLLYSLMYLLNVFSLRFPRVFILPPLLHHCVINVL